VGVRVDVDELLARGEGEGDTTRGWREGEWCTDARRRKKRATYGWSGCRARVEKGGEMHGRGSLAFLV
jgi:hypothetical protein